MDLKSLIVQDTVIKIEHPLLEGFVVEVAFISKDKTRKMLEKATTTKYNKRTHKPEDNIDNNLFLSMYSKNLIKGWEGLKFEYLNYLLPVDLKGQNLEDTVEYSQENALELLKNSTDFDGWLSSAVEDVSVFNKAN